MRKLNLKSLEERVQKEDSYILLREPHIETIKVVTVQFEQVNWYYKWEKFCYWLGTFLKYYYFACERNELPDSLADLEQFRNNVRLTIGANKKAFKALVKCCGFAKFKKRLKTRVMKKLFSIDDWITAFVYMYFYNIKSVKKNFADAYNLAFGAPLN